MAQQILLAKTTFQKTIKNFQQNIIKNRPKIDFYEFL